MPQRGEIRHYCARHDSYSTRVHTSKSIPTLARVVTAWKCCFFRSLFLLLEALHTLQQRQQQQRKGREKKRTEGKKRLKLLQRWILSIAKHVLRSIIVASIKLHIIIYFRSKCTELMSPLFQFFVLLWNSKLSLAIDSNGFMCSGAFTLS